MKALFLLILLATPIAAQESAGVTPPPPQNAYADPVARQLVERARSARDELGRSITGYSAHVQQRWTAVLRMPLKDRTLARSERTAHVRWSRDDETVVRILASREQALREVSASTRFDSNLVFDPTSDRISFGLGFGSSDSDEEQADEEPVDEERADSTESRRGASTSIVHPLTPGSESHYSYASGDTITVQLPGGATIRAIELRVAPTRPSFQYLTASLWIEPESGALVQAAYRPSRNLDLERDADIVDTSNPTLLRRLPGLLRPLEADIDLVVVEYSLWNQKHWLPRLMRFEGYARAGVLRLPFGSEIAYRIEEVWDEERGPPTDSAAFVLDLDAEGLEVRETTRRGRAVRVVHPRDTASLMTSPELPPPFGDTAPDFATEAELTELLERLDALSTLSAIPATISYEWGYGANLLRYNRVEGLSIGARARVEHGAGEAQLLARLGSADRRPNLEFRVARPGRDRTLGLDLYHRLEAADPDSRALGLGNSLSALLLGRDEGEYYRATGGRISLQPGGVRRASYRAELFAERHRAAGGETDWSVRHLFDREWEFRPNIVADEGTLLGGSLTVAPWWGSNPTGRQAGAVLFVEGAGGDFEFVRTSATLLGAMPLGGRYRLGAEIGGGTSWGALPLQRNWFLGGARTLRGYPGSTLTGPSFARGRVELARRTGFGSLLLFHDAAWAGQRAAFDLGDRFHSAGVGLSVLDGLLRIDLARGLREPGTWRLELQVDALM